MSADSTSIRTSSRAPAAELDARKLIEAIHALRSEVVSERDGGTGSYWARYCELLAPLARAQRVCAVRLGDAAQWCLLADSVADSVTASASLPAHWLASLPDLADRAGVNGFAYAPMRDAQGRGLLAAVVRLGMQQDQIFLLLEIPEHERARLNELLLRVQLVSDLPLHDQEREALPATAVSRQVVAASEPRVGAEPQSTAEDPSHTPPPTPADDSTLAALLDLSALVMREKHYGAAGLALVNGLAARLGCALVVLGWRHDGYVKIEAISHLDRFERRTEYVNLLEGACEEALDQESDIVHAADASNAFDAGLVTQAHVKLQRALGYPQIVTLPVQGGGAAPEAVLLLALESGALATAQIANIHLGMGLILPWLNSLRAADRAWGVRLGGWARGRVEALFGPEQPIAKLFAIALMLLLAYALFGVKAYRIEAASQLGTDSTRLIAASYDGFVEQVGASSGDTVKKASLLAALDTRELIQQEAEAQADLQRFKAEADKARAGLALADAEIAGRRLAQVQARLKRIRFSLGQSRIYAPFDSVVVEGERKDLLGAPVKKGDRLFRLARIEGLYAVLQVPESEIRYVERNAQGELTLLARPDVRIPFRVETLMPVAQVKGQDGNHFVIKARLLHAPESWWRPGMSGMARIDAGERNVAWIYTHKAIDALRMKFWL
jgi:hypothetical protein